MSLAVHSDDTTLERTMEGPKRVVESNQEAADDDPTQRLDPGTEVYEFVTAQDLKRRVRHAKDILDKKESNNQYVAFQHVDPATAERLWSLMDKSGRIAYDSLAKTFIIKLVSSPHEVTGRRLEAFLLKEVGNMNLEDELLPLGQTRVNHGQSAKEPDSSYRPVTLPGARSTDWPSVVVEVGYSESSVKLRSDAAWWLISSGGEVKVALAIHVAPRRRHILIERWQSVMRSGRGGRQSLKAETAQSINITSQNGTPTASDSLTIPFEGIFLRQPNPPEEHDLVISRDELEKIAKTTWEVQDEA